jgi:hypothetical protein
MHLFVYSTKQLLSATVIEHARMTHKENKNYNKLQHNQDDKIFPKLP